MLQTSDSEVKSLGSGFQSLISRSINVTLANQAKEKGILLFQSLISRSINVT